MKKDKNFIKLLIALGVLLVIALLMLGIYYKNKPKTNLGSKKIVVEVIVPKEESNDFTIYTDAQYLGQALQEKNLVKGTKGDYGLFITEVNGHTANETKQEWWCITKDGENVNTSADQTPITDGDHYEITLTTGY